MLRNKYFNHKIGSGEMRKILIVSTVSRQFYLFEQANIEILKSLGYEVHGAANFEDANERLDSLDIVRHPFDIQRSPFSLKNIKAFIELKKTIESEKFDVVHCHSPMGGVLARLAALKARNKGTKVIYTAHGFHFFKGAPLINWLVYYPIERWLSKYTDVLITINIEDFIRAKREFKANKIEYIPGIGIDLTKFNDCKVDKEHKRSEIGLGKDNIVMLSVGEINKNKNHKIAIKVLAKLRNPNIHYVICGRGPLEKYLKNLSRKLGIEKQVHFIGFRKDVIEICKASDLFIFPSYREGLSVALMEAMACGIPVVCSKIRGNYDLIKDQEGGYLVNPSDINSFKEKINFIIENKCLVRRFCEYNKEIIKNFSKDAILLRMRKIY